MYKRQVYGRAPYRTRVGGSIPVMTTLLDTLGVHAVMFGFSHGDENLHAPNEFFRLDAFRLGPVSYTHLDVYKRQAPVPRGLQQARAVGLHLGCVGGRLARRQAGESVPIHVPKGKRRGIAIAKHRVSLGPVRNEGLWQGPEAVSYTHLPPWFDTMIAPAQVSAASLAY